MSWVIEFEDGSLWHGGENRTTDTDEAIQLVDKQSAQQIIDNYPLPGGRARQL